MIPYCFLLNEHTAFIGNPRLLTDIPSKITIRRTRSCDSITELTKKLEPVKSRPKRKPANYKNRGAMKPKCLGDDDEDSIMASAIGPACDKKIRIH